MKRKIITASTDYIHYDVVVSFDMYPNAEEEITVYAKAGATKDDIMNAVIDDYADDLLEGEVIDFDGDDAYVVEVTFAGYIGVSEEYTEYADSEEDAIEQAIYDATWDLRIESFSPSR